MKICVFLFCNCREERFSRAVVFAFNCFSGEIKGMIHRDVNKRRSAPALAQREREKRYNYGEM